MTTPNNSAQSSAAAVREAAARLAKFRDEWAKMRNTGDDIQGLHMGDNREAILRSSDIGIILSALTTLSQPDEAAQPDNDAWMLAHEVEGEFMVGPPHKADDEQDENGNAVWFCEVQTAGGHSVIATVWGGSATEAEKRAERCVDALAAQPPERERVVAWLRYLAGVFVTPPYWLLSAIQQAERANCFVWDWPTRSSAATIWRERGDGLRPVLP